MTRDPTPAPEREAPREARAPKPKPAEAWAPRRREWQWRDYLTSDERRIIEAGDKALREADAIRASASTVTRRLIMNRALQRAKYAAGATVAPAPARARRKT